MDVHTSRPNHPVALGLVLASSVWLSLSVPAVGDEIVGFTEPYRTVDVAAGDSGLIAEINVREGDAVSAGQLVGELDQSVLMIARKIAEKASASKGALDSAAAELELRRVFHEKLQALHAKNAASREELERAQAEVKVAEAQLLSVEENLAIRSLELRRVEAEMERRRIRAPIDGVVIRLFREPGEFTSPNSPQVMTIVQLDPLMAKFSVESRPARRYELGQGLEVEIGDAGKVQGVIEYISPVTDAQSGTVQMKVRIDNSRGRYRSGERCILRQ